MRLLRRLRPSQLPLRVRLTLWYTFSLGLILALFTTFLYLQVRRSLVAQVDAALSLAANQALLNLGEEAGQLAFQNVERNPEAIRNLSDDFVIRLLTREGVIGATLSSDPDAPRFAAQPAGFHTLSAEGEPWRVYSQAVTVGSASGQLQIAQELEPVNATLASLQAQFLVGFALALSLAGMGGYFLAAHALRPIDHITRTAQAISQRPSVVFDAGQRIRYQGPADEVGRLAQTFDNMLDRLQAAFGRERRFTGDAAPPRW